MRKKLKILSFYIISTFCFFFSFTSVAKADTGLFKVNLNSANGSENQSVYMHFDGEKLNLYNKLETDTENFANITTIGTEIPTRKGYAFYGYYLANNSQPFINQDATFNSENIIEYLKNTEKVEKTLELKAKWIKLDYRIDLISNGRVFRKIYFSDLNDDVIYSKDSLQITKVDIPLCINENYEFAGFYVGKVKVIDENGNFILVNKNSNSKDKVALIKKALSGNKAVYIKAKWKKKSVQNQESNVTKEETSEGNNTSGNKAEDSTNSEVSNEGTSETAQETVPKEESNTTTNVQDSLETPEKDYSTDDEIKTEESKNDSNNENTTSETTPGTTTETNVPGTTTTETTIPDTEGNQVPDSSSDSSVENGQIPEGEITSNDSTETTETETEKIDDKNNYEENFVMQYEDENGVLETETTTEETSSEPAEIEEPIEDSTNEDSEVGDTGTESTDTETETDTDTDGVGDDLDDIGDQETEEETENMSSQKYALCYLKDNNVSVGETKTFKYTTKGYTGYSFSIKAADSEQKVIKITGNKFKGLKVGTINVKLIGTLNGKSTNIRNCSIMVHSSPVKSSEQKLMASDETTNNLIKTSSDLDMKDLTASKTTQTPKSIKCGTNEVKVGTTKTLSYFVNPSSANQGVTIKASNSASKKKIKITGTKIKGLKTGTAKVVVTSKKKSSVKKTCTIKVKNNTTPKKSTSNNTKQTVTSIKLTTSKNKINVGGTTTIKATINKNTAVKSKKWSSSSSVATVSSSGKVTGKKPGSANIKLTVVDKKGKTKTKSIKITVSCPSGKSWNKSKQKCIKK